MCLGHDYNSDGEKQQIRHGCSVWDSLCDATLLTVNMYNMLLREIWVLILWVATKTLQPRDYNLKTCAAAGTIIYCVLNY
jgi:hypothetical protein